MQGLGRLFGLMWLSLGPRLRVSVGLNLFPTPSFDFHSGSHQRWPRLQSGCEHPRGHSILQPPQLRAGERGPARRFPTQVQILARLKRPPIPTFPEDWMPLIMAKPTRLQATSRHRVIFQLSPPLSEMELEMSRASRYQK